MFCQWILDAERYKIGLVRLDRDEGKFLAEWLGPYQLPFVLLTVVELCQRILELIAHLAG